MKFFYATIGICLFVFFVGYKVGAALGIVHAPPQRPKSEAQKLFEEAMQPRSYRYEIPGEDSQRAAKRNAARAIVEEEVARLPAAIARMRQHASDIRRAPRGSRSAFTEGWDLGMSRVSRRAIGPDVRAEMEKGGFSFEAYDKLWARYDEEREALEKLVDWSTGRVR